MTVTLKVRFLEVLGDILQPDTCHAVLVSLLRFTRLTADSPSSSTYICNGKRLPKRN